MTEYFKHSTFNSFNSFLHVLIGTTNGSRS
jgi:hypothetical protein